MYILHILVCTMSELYTVFDFTYLAYFTVCPFHALCSFLLTRCKNSMVVCDLGLAFNQALLGWIVTFCLCFVIVLLSYLNNFLTCLLCFGNGIHFPSWSHVSLRSSVFFFFSCIKLCFLILYIFWVSSENNYWYSMWIEREYFSSTSWLL